MFFPEKWVKIPEYSGKMGQNSGTFRKNEVKFRNIPEK